MRSLKTRFNLTKPATLFFLSQTVFSLSEVGGFPKRKEAEKKLLPVVSSATFGYALEGFG
jgi:hypothetical protein